MATVSRHPLHPGWGYGLIIGLGFLFAGGMVVITWLMRRYQNSHTTAENFSTAGRSVKSGLVAAAVSSTWTWAATLLQSSAVAYRYGVSGPFWYASGATIQIILFAAIPIELKRRAPNAHTFLEAVKARYGPITHGVYIVFSIFTNILVHTMIGGIKATFMTDYVNSLVIIIVIFVFAFTTYATNDVLGSPGRVYDILMEITKERPVPGNAGGSYLTMRSEDGGIFFVINIIGNFGTVFMDNAYYNKAISASPVHALPGYVMGGLSWFAIPWLCATTMGLAALALETNPVFPTFPNRLSDADVTAGLVLPQAAVAMLGQGGAIACLILMFMAVTSTFSAELISVSSILTYDVYKTYVNPKASGRQLIWISYSGVFFFAIALAGFSTGLYYIGISMGYLYLMMGVIISAAVLPATLTLLWSGQSWAAATFSPILGFACALTGWLVKAKTEFGELSVDATGSNMPMLVGNCISLLSPIIFIAVLTFVPPFKPQNYDWQSMLDIKQAVDADEERDEDLEQRQLLRARTIARVLVVCLTLALLLVWPIPMYASGYIFSKQFFTGWVVVGILWLFASLFMVGFIPLWESRASIARMFRCIYEDISGKGKPAIVHGEPEVVSEAASIGKLDLSEKMA